jgi:hypothetical protein
MAVITGAQMWAGQKGAGANSEETGKAVKAALAQYAADRGLSDQMVIAIHRIRVPEDADLLWWIGQWTDLLLAHATSKHAT